MFQTVFDANELPEPDRLACFDDLQTNSDHPMRAFSTAGERFTARVRSMDLAPVNVVELSSSDAGIIRTERQVRDFDPELCAIVLPVEGRLVVEQAGQQAAVDRGQLALYTSSRPFRVRIEASDREARLVRVQVPRSLVHLPASRLDGLLAQPISTRSGTGALLAGFVAQLGEQAPSYTAADLPRLGNVVVDLMTATLAHQLDESEPAETDSTLVPRILAFISSHLEEPDLSPHAVAAAHHISVSYLHRLFRARDVTVGAWIRVQRLERARRDLADVRLQAVPIHRIAARWGFGDHATFSRAFRAAFGASPREYRLGSTPIDAAPGGIEPRAG